MYDEDVSDIEWAALRRANERIPHLLSVPARVRFLSCEPLLEAVDLVHALGGMPVHAEEGHAANCDGSCFESPRISWVIVGGESGPGARPFDLGWARSIVAQCDAAGVPVFVKQMGARPVGAWGGGKLPLMTNHPADRGRWILNDRAGADPSQWPADLRRQRFPGVSHVG